MNDVFEKIREICEKNQFHVLSKQIDNLSKKLKREEDFINIAIVGQFKSGKSSFLNSFIGLDLLPTGVIPVTSVITRIYASSENQIKVIFNDGKYKLIEKNEIESYVSETSNPKNFKNVLCVDIMIPTLFDNSKIRFLDTPGIGSIFKHNTRVTNEWFTEIDLVLLCISSERPLAEEEFNMIRELRHYCPEIVILITKIDLFSSQQLDDIQNFIEISLKNEFSDKFRIYRYSIHKDTEKYRNLLIDNLITPIINKYETSFNKIVKEKIKLLAENCIGYLSIAQKVAINSEIEKQNLLSLICEEQLNKTFLYQELQLISVNQKNRTRDLVYSILQKHEEIIVNELVENFNKDYQNWKGNLYKISRKFEEWLKENLTYKILEIVDYEFDKLNDINKNNRQHFQYFLKSFGDRLSTSVEKVLGIKLQIQEFDIELKRIKKPDISISWTFEIHIDMLWFLFPMCIFKSFFKKHFLKLIKYETNKNIQRITSDLTEEINKMISLYERQSASFISEQLNGIEEVLLKSKKESEYYHHQIKEVSDLVKKLI